MMYAASRTSRAHDGEYSLSCAHVYNVLIITNTRVCYTRESIV